jgi:hypothetical protein
MPAAQLPAPMALDPPQSFLFSDEEIAKVTDEEQRYGRYTLDRLPAAKRQSILVLLKERRALREIARLLSVAFETVQAVAVAHAKELDEHWKELPRHLRRATWYMVDRLERNIESIPAPALPAAIKQISECWLLLDGQATSRVEHVIGAPRVNSLEEYEQQIAPIEKKIAGKVIEPAEKIGLLAGKKTAPALELEPAAADPGAAVTDSESDVPGPIAQASAESATLYCNTSGPNQARTGPPGGGSPARAQAGGSALHP